MNDHEQLILNHILNGGSITVPTETNPVIFTALISKEIELDLTELINCTIYNTPDQLTIIKLKQQLADMTDKLTEIKTQKTKLGADLREVNGSGPKQIKKSPYRSHLTTEEVREVEQVLKQDWSTSNKTIQTAYGLSQTITWRIRYGKHSKSSETYINHLKNIGQYKH